ncbi:MAG: tRNA preQ1(34) S-adenosylmethionine ribosyltransferase-isomerase QueA [Thermodesulfobacteriota bacterium]
MGRTPLPEPEPLRYDLDAYDYPLPEEAIAQAPARERDASRLLVLHCRENRTEQLVFRQIVERLAPGDLVVVNDTRVFPARLLAVTPSGGRREVLLLGYPAAPPPAAGGWQSTVALALVRGRRGSKPQPLSLGPDLEVVLPAAAQKGPEVQVELRYRGVLDELLARYGQMPLPPYIRRNGPEQEEDRERYQTVYAGSPGAVAAPTAGLHFSPGLLAAIRARGVGIASITLHVGYGTFQPVRVPDIRQHAIHAELVSVTADTAQAVNATRSAGGRLFVVGTTTARALEFAAGADGRLRPCQDWCRLYIYPGYRFRVVENLITNFHLPRSSLLFLVSALAGRERILAAYQEALAAGWRFFSYGDAMLIMR